MTLREYILTGPRAAEFAPLVAAGNHAGVLALLRQPTEPGHVPPRHVAAVLMQTGVMGAVGWAWKHGEFPGGAPVPAPIAGLIATIFFALEHPTYSFELPPADLAAGADAMAAIGVTGEVKAMLLAGELKRSWPLAHLGREVTLDDVSDALKE